MPFHISHIWWITKHINANSFPKINVKNESLFEFLLLLTACPTFQIRSDAACDFVRGVCLSFLFGRILEKQKVLGHHHQLASVRMIQWNWKLYCPRPLAHIAPSSLLSAITWAAISWPWWCANTQSTREDRDLVFFIFATMDVTELWSRTWGLILKIQQEPGLHIGIEEALDRSQPLCYFVTQKFQCQAGSTRRHQTKN